MVNDPGLKKRDIRRFITATAPKRTKKLPGGEHKEIPRAVSKDGLALIVKDLNTRLESIVKACEEALGEINANPNSTFSQKRYNLKVVEDAIKALKKKELEDS